MNVITLLLNLVHSFTLLKQNIHKLLYVRSSSQRKVAVVNNSCWYVICHPSVGDWRINWRTYSALNWLYPWNTSWGGFFHHHQNRHAWERLLPGSFHTMCLLCHPLQIHHHQHHPLPQQFGVQCTSRHRWDRWSEWTWQCTMGCKLDCASPIHRIRFWQSIGTKHCVCDCCSLNDWEQTVDQWEHLGGAKPSMDCTDNRGRRTWSGQWDVEKTVGNYEWLGVGLPNFSCGKNAQVRSLSRRQLPSR